MAKELEGIYENMSYEAYAAVPAMNASKLIHMRRSPMKYKHELDNPTPPSPAMEMGSLIHRMILEPELVGNIAVWGTEPDQKVRNGARWKEFQKLHKDEIILTVAQRDEAVGTANAALNNAPIFKYARSEGPTEVSMFWRHPHTRRRYKARLDKVITETHTIFDLKKTRDCHSFKFGGQSFSLGYHIKMAHYWEGYRTLIGVEANVILGAIESKQPHESAVYRVTKDVILQGLEERDRLASKLEFCEKSGRWPAEHEEETDLILPPWADSGDYEAEDTM